MTDPPGPPQSVAVIGAGAAGLGAAWLLARGGYAVHLFEARETAGGHAHTIDVPIPGNTTGATIPVDAGFIVYNTRTYPDLVSLFQMLGVEEENSSMSFAASIELESSARFFEWGSDSPATVFADRASLFNTSMYAMLYDMRRFNNAVYHFVDKLENEPTFKDKDISLGEFLENGSYSTVFIRCYLIPMVSAVWSASFAAAMAFPARSLFHFFVNHGLAQVFDRPQWRAPAGRSREYVTKVINDIRDHSGIVLLGTPVSHVVRDSEGVTVYADTTGQKRFDQVVFATHAPTTLELLGPDATEDERRILGAFQYSENKAYIHCDPRLMPTNRTIWSSWNFIGRKRQRPDARDSVPTANGPAQDESRESGPAETENIPIEDEEPVCVSYWLNKLQNYHKYHLPVPDLFLTLNPVTPIDPEKILVTLTFGHPQFTEEAVKAQPLLQEVVQGENRSWFCGSYARFGFHEDAMMMGLNVAERLSGYQNLRPWKSKHRLVINDNTRQYELPYSPLRTPVIFFLGALVVLNAVMSRLQHGLGRIAARMTEDDPGVVVAVGDGRLHRFGPRRSLLRSRSQANRSGDISGPATDVEPQLGRVTVRTPKLLARITEALRQGHQLAPTAAAAFAAAEFDCPTPQDLTITLKALFIADGLDLDPSKARKGRAKFAESLLFSIVGGFRKIKSLPTHTRLPELTTCISSVVYPSWWLEMDTDALSGTGKEADGRTLPIVSPGDLNSSSHTLELLGDLSEATIAILQGNKDSLATVVVRTAERMLFVDRKAELLFVKRQIDIVLLEDFLGQRNEESDVLNSSGKENVRYDIILSPALVNIYKGCGFETFGDSLLFLRGLASKKSLVEFGATVYGTQRSIEARKGPDCADALFSGDDGFFIGQTGAIIAEAEKHGFELQSVSFMNNEEASLDVYEVIQRVYNSLAIEKLEPDETRMVLAQMCLWEAALFVKHVRRMTASFKLVRTPP